MGRLREFAGQATVYVLREQGHLWGSRPPQSCFCFDRRLAVVAALAIGGLLMTPIAPAILSALLATVAYGLELDFVKLAVLARLRID